MKYLVVSDIHGSLFYAKLMKELFEKEKADKLILLGDLYYHGPRNFIPRNYNPMEVSKLLNSMKEHIICIKGNCDAEVDEMISEFKFNEYVILEISGKKFMFTHGHHVNIDNQPENVDVLVYGHFHTGFIKEEDGMIFVNSGSITLPKNNTEHSYLVIDEDKIYLKGINELVIDSISFVEK